MVGENTTTYDGQGLKGALWTVAGTAIGSVALNALKTMHGDMGGIGVAGANVATQAANAAVMLDIARKDAEIAQLKADAATDAKLVQVYTELRKQDKEQDAKIGDLNTRVTSLETSAPYRDEILKGKIGEVATLAQNGIATNSAAIANLAVTVNNITKTVVPITSVCPQPMPQYNSWTAPTTPTTAG